MDARTTILLDAARALLEAAAQPDPRTAVRAALERLLTALDESGAPIVCPACGLARTGIFSD